MSLVEAETVPDGEIPVRVEAGPPANLRKHMRAGAISWGLSGLAARVVRVGVQVGLGWLLTRSDYGLAGMTAAFMLVLQTVSEFGVGISVIQKKDMPEWYPTTAFWLNFAMSAVMFAVAWALAPWLAKFYGAPEIKVLTEVSAAGFLITALRTIPMAIMRKRLQFGMYALLDSSWNALSGILAIVFAWFGAGYWSLVIPSMITGVLYAPAWFYYAGWTPSFTIRRGAFREIFSYSKNIVGVSLLSLLLGNFGFVLVGHYDGTDAAGIFKLSTDNAMFVVTNFAWLIANVFISGFALQQDDPERLRRSFQRAYVFLGAVTLPAHAILFALAPWLFSGVLPSTWLPAVILFRVILVWSAVRSLTSHNTAFLNAVNRSQVSLIYTVLMTILTLPLMWLGSKYYGTFGVAVASSIPPTLCTIAMLGAMNRLMNWTTPIPFVRSIRAYILASALAALVTAAVANGMDRLHIHGAIIFCAAGMIGGLAYCGVLYFFAYPRFYAIADDACPERFRNLMVRYLPPPVVST